MCLINVSTFVTEYLIKESGGEMKSKRLKCISIHYLL